MNRHLFQLAALAAAGLLCLSSARAAEKGARARDAKNNAASAPDKKSPAPATVKKGSAEKPAAAAKKNGAPTKKPAAEKSLAKKTPAPKPPPRVLFEKALAGPLKDIEEIVFATRARYSDGHWYANIGYYCNDETQKAYAGNGEPDPGKLYKHHLRTGKTTVLFDPEGGSVRDPQVHYDGGKILFAYRQAEAEHYHLYEIDADGENLNRITSGAYDDFEPAYLPDGGIVFVSTRCNCWVNCWMTQVAVIHRCDADGSNIRRLSANNEHDNTPWVLPDGRILYTRWEYVDRSQVAYHHLWTMNPDGANQAVYYGNMHATLLMIDAKPIPGTQQVLVSFSPGHGRNEHAGEPTILTPDKGPDDKASARILKKRMSARDPWPLSRDLFMMAQGNNVLLMDAAGETETLLQADLAVHEPRPLAPRPRERVILPRTDWTQPTGRMILADAHQGRQLPGVKRGDVKKLLILESLPKQVNFSGGMDILTWQGSFTLERVLGTVPVEADGSAYFELPANRALLFVTLDENDLSVKRMQSFTSVMPGETLSCVGCHEERAGTPRNQGRGALLALQRPPSKIAPFEGIPGVIDMHRDVQPILDKHCVKCHTYTKREGQIILEGDLGKNWSHSYFSLIAHNQIADGRNGLGNQPPRTIGSSASALLKKVDGSHHDVKVSEREWRTLWMWIESGAPYTGSYAALRNEHQAGLANQTHGMVYGRQQATIQRRCGACHLLTDPYSEIGRPLPFSPASKGNDRGTGRRVASYERVILENDPVARYGSNILLNFTRPEFSPLLLGPLAKAAGGYGSCGEVFKDKDDPDYQKILETIEAAKTHIDQVPRYSTPDFKPNRQYVREMKKYGVLPPDFDLAKNAIDVFETDQKYWSMYGHQPNAKAAH